MGSWGKDIKYGKWKNDGCNRKGINNKGKWKRGGGIESGVKKRIEKNNSEGNEGNKIIIRIYNKRGGDERKNIRMERNRVLWGRGRKRDWF